MYHIHTSTFDTVRYFTFKTPRYMNMEYTIIYLFLLIKKWINCYGHYRGHILSYYLSLLHKQQVVVTFHE